MQEYVKLKLFILKKIMNKHRYELHWKGSTNYRISFYYQVDFDIILQCDLNRGLYPNTVYLGLSF